MKYLLLLAFVVGDLVHFIDPTILTAGIWRVTKVQDGIYELYDDKYPCTITNVPEKVLQKYKGKV